MTRSLLLTTITLLAAAGTAAAQDDDRSLRWEEVRVEARLDADGRLHVRERQTMVFDGAWNGGERQFDVRAGQRLHLEGVSRVEPRTGELVPLTWDDDVDDVDEVDIDNDGARWRSRAGDAPPFDDERIAYVLDYTLGNAILPLDTAGGRWLLDYDFLFADRAGPVERFILTLELDSAWAPDGTAIPGRWEAGPIPAGNGFAVHIPLRRLVSGGPASVPVPAPEPLRLALIILLLSAGATMAGRFLARERAAGRFEPFPEVTGEPWLREHVFRYDPELVGAAWDGSTAAPEVAGLIARLVQEGKLASRVEADENGEPVLHLALEVPRDAFDETERPLIDALFFDGRERTDTRTVREHYEDEGFDPANTISDALEKRVAALPGAGRRPMGTAPATFALIAALGLLLAAAITRPGDAPAAGISFIAALGAGLVALGFAATYARKVTGLRGLAAGVIVTLTVLVGTYALVIAGGFETTDLDSDLSPYYHAGPLLLLALTAIALAIVALTLRLARPRDTPERLELRRRLAAARAWLRDQLEKPDPDLRDDWFPWLLALGLGTHVDRWFEAHGPTAGTAAGTLATHTAAAAAGRSGAARSGGSAASAGSGGWTGGGPTFGGGGGFAGGGVGASWGVAAAAVASGVAAPGSGTAGGVASAGGGSGGGW